MSLNKEHIYSIFSLRYNKYSTPFYPHKTIQDFEEWGEPHMGWDETIKDTLYYSIRALNEYSNIAISLSGGLDSTLILAMLRHTFPTKRITAIIDDCSGEADVAEKIANKYNCNKITIHRPSVFKHIPDYVNISKEPRWNVYQRDIARMAKKMGCDCLLTGDGGDELFGGYIFRYKQFSEGKHYMECHINDWVEDFNLLFKEAGGSWFSSELSFNFDLYAIPHIDAVMLADYNGKLLHDFLPVSKRISEWYDIPIIAPFMSMKDIAPHIPTKEKINVKESIGKIILRRMAVDLGLPQETTKVGYSVDFLKDYKKNQPLVLSRVCQALKDDDVSSIINTDWVDKHTADLDYRNANKMTQIWCLHEYIKSFK